MQGALIFEDLVREHQAMVFSLALRFLGDRAAAEESAQDVFLQLHRHLGDMQSAEHVVFWLRRVTVNRCISEARRRGRRPEVPLDELEEPEAPAADCDPLADEQLRKMVATGKGAGRGGAAIPGRSRSGGHRPGAGNAGQYRKEPVAARFGHASEESGTDAGEEMMDRFEQQLKDALGREEAPPGFAARVTALAREQEQKSWWSRRFAMRLRWAAALAICVVMVGGILLQQERERERAKGEAAKQQVKLALHIAGSKVRLAQNMVQKINEKSLENEQ